MLVKDVDLKIVSKETFYNGSGYRTRYGVTDTKVETQSSQKFIIKIPSAGFIAKGNRIVNFYIHNGKGFDTFPKTSFGEVNQEVYEDFKKALANER